MTHKRHVLQTLQVTLQFLKMQTLFPFRECFHAPLPSTHSSWVF